LSGKIDFIKKELKKKGYPLEHFVQGILDSKEWYVQPNAYFLDKDTQKGREIDIMAEYECSEFSTWTSFFPRLLVECKKMLGNAWVFFSTPDTAHTQTLHSGLAKWLEIWNHGILDNRGARFNPTNQYVSCSIVSIYVSFHKS
jgi:hypothetical protein